MIEARTLNVAPLGQYDPARRQLQLPGGVCIYDNRGIGDPKDQLLCVPIGVDSSLTSIPPAVVCVSSDRSPATLFDQPLVDYIVRQAYLIGVTDPRWMTEQRQTAEGG